MGYGQNLKEILSTKKITVKELSRRTGVAATTIYSIIQRDASVRFDTALKIANVLDIPIDAICKDNPYDDIETLPILSENSNGTAHHSYISSRTEKILQKFNYSELPMVDQLIADLFVLDDVTRSDLFDYVNMLKKNHTDPDREKEIREIKIRG